MRHVLASCWWLMGARVQHELKDESIRVLKRVQVGFVVRFHMHVPIFRILIQFFVLSSLYCTYNSTASLRNNRMDLASGFDLFFILLCENPSVSKGTGWVKNDRFRVLHLFSPSNFRRTYQYVLVSSPLSFVNHNRLPR